MHAYGDAFLCAAVRSRGLSGGKAGGDGPVALVADHQALFALACAAGPAGGDVARGEKAGDDAGPIGTEDLRVRVHEHAAEGAVRRDFPIDGVKRPLADGPQRLGTLAEVLVAPLRAEAVVALDRLAQRCGRNAELCGKMLDGVSCFDRGVELFLRGEFCVDVREERRIRPVGELLGDLGLDAAVKDGPGDAAGLVEDGARALVERAAATMPAAPAPSTTMSASSDCGACGAGAAVSDFGCAAPTLHTRAQRPQSMQTDVRMLYPVPM